MYHNVYFFMACEKKAVAFQIFVEQLAILITNHIPAQTKSAHNHTFLHKVRVVNYSLIMQMCDILF